MDGLCMLPLSPQRVPVKFNFCQKKSVTKFLCAKTSSSRVVATPFPYIMVHRWIAGDVSIYLKFVLKLTHPLENVNFDRFFLAVPQPWELAKKVRLPLTGSRQCAFSSSHRWTLCFTPKSPNGWLKTWIFTLCVAFHIFVAGNHRHFKFGMWIEHSKSPPTDDKLCLKWVWSRHVTHFKFLVPLRYLWNGLS